MRTLLIKDDIVENVIVATKSEAESAFPDYICVESDVAGIGWTYVDGVFTPPSEPEKTPEQIYLEMESAVDTHIDSVAQAKGYDNRITVTMRAGYENPWQAEGIAFGQWMDSCYLYCQQVQADIAAEIRTIPTVQELIAELPQIVWPT